MTDDPVYLVSVPRNTTYARLLRPLRMDVWLGAWRQALPGRSVVETMDVELRAEDKP